MATSGIFNGTDLNIFIDRGAIVLEEWVEDWQPIAHATSCELSLSHSPRDTSTKDSAGETERAPGKLDWSISADALYAIDYTDSEGMTELFDAIENNEKLKIKFSSEVVGDQEYDGEGYVTDLSLNAGVEENASYSVSIAGTGALTKTTIPEGA